jgi:hypothetical protein
MTKKARREFGGRFARNSQSRITSRWRRRQGAVVIDAIAIGIAGSREYSVKDEDSDQTAFAGHAIEAADSRPTRIFVIPPIGTLPFLQTGVRPEPCES